MHIKNEKIIQTKTMKNQGIFVFKCPCYNLVVYLGAVAYFDRDFRKSEFYKFYPVWGYIQTS